MSRYALLPTPGDPAVVTLWKTFYDRVWADLFDGLLVYYNPPKILAGHAGYVFGLFDAQGITVVLWPGTAGHGQALRELVLNECIALDDIVGFFEDDSLVFKRSRLAGALSALDDRTDIVASPRCSASPGLISAETARFGTCQAGEDTGPNFWPNLFFARKSLLLRTDLDFGSHGWPAGEYIPALDWTPDEDQAGDTLVWMSIQLRALTDRVRLVPQWHSSPYDLECARCGAGIWSDACEWFHVGSLSSIPFGSDLSGVRLDTPAERLEWERRLMYVWLASEEAGRVNPSFQLADDYLEWVTETARQLSLDLERMQTWKQAYRERLGLDV